VRATVHSIIRTSIISLFVASATPPVQAAVPAGFAEVLVTAGLSNPTAMAFAPDGRLFVCQQGGQLRVIQNGVLLAAPFVTLTVDSNGERGLLGVAFDPAFASNHYVYVYYTATTPAIHNRVSRFTADGNVATAMSETVLLELDNLTGATNHNGGAIHFAPDGTLFVAVGENATSSNAQTLGNLLGKMLRINADGSIPADNPFYLQATGKNRAIWALGLRNPFTFAFQPGVGRMFINDVGQNAWEEINDGIAGSNYGWPNSEGPTVTAGERTPLYSYGHGTGPMLGCAITGGAFYNPAVSQFPAGYVGAYFFADLCGGWINRFTPSTSTVVSFASGISSPVDLQLGADGNLYYLARGTGRVYRVVYGFTDDPLVAGVSVIRAVHIAELRAHVDGQRVRFGLSPFSWTDASLVGATVKAVHITQLRTALQQAYSQAGQPAPIFTDSPLVAQTTAVRMLHVKELRDAVVALEAS